MYRQLLTSTQIFGYAFTEHPTRSTPIGEELAELKELLEFQ